MLWRFLSERKSERGGGLMDPFANPKRDVRLEVTLDLVCEASFGMEPCVDFLVDLYRVSLVGGEVTHNCAGGGFRACSCSSWLVHKV